jgi:hypothetical protein
MAADDSDAGVLVIPMKSRRPFGRLVRYANGGVSPQLVATAQSLSSPRWSVDWDHVASVTIGRMPGMGCRSLCIEPVARSDVRHKPSKAVGILRRLDSLGGMPAIQLPETLFDQPLEEIIAELSEKANRPLG